MSSNNGSDMETLSPDKGGNHEVCPPKSHEKEISEEGDPTPMSTQVLTQMVKDVVNDGVKETIQKTQNENVKIQIHGNVSKGKIKLHRKEKGK